MSPNANKPFRKRQTHTPTLTLTPVRVQGCRDAERVAGPRSGRSPSPSPAQRRERRHRKKICMFEYIINMHNRSRCFCRCVCRCSTQLSRVRLALAPARALRLLASEPTERTPRRHMIRNSDRGDGRLNTRLFSTWQLGGRSHKGAHPRLLYPLVLFLFFIFIFYS